MVVDFEKVTRELKKLKEKKRKKERKILSKKLVSRKVFKPSQMTITIKQKEPEPYKPIFFKETLDNEKRSLFFD